MPLVFATAALPALFWLFFFLREDRHPEPKKLILYVFCLGGLAGLPTLLLQIFFQKLIINFNGSVLILVLGLALFEEFFKFLAAYLAVRNNPEFEEPVDAMIYMIAAASGFATIENLFVTANSINSSNIFSTADALSVLSVRFVGATLLHALTSGLVGYYWAKSTLLGSFRKIMPFAIILAALLHAFFNYLVLIFQDYNMMYPSLFLIFLAFFVFNNFEKLHSAKYGL